MWYAPVTSYAWFNQYGNTKQPAAEKFRSSVMPVAGEYMRKNVYSREPERKANGTSAARRDHDRSSKPYHPRNPYPTPAKPCTTNKYARQASRGSPQYNGSSIVDLEKGEMLNPKSTRRS